MKPKRLKLHAWFKKSPYILCFHLTVFKNYLHKFLNLEIPKLQEHLNKVRCYKKFAKQWMCSVTISRICNRIRPMGCSKNAYE